MFRKHHPQPGSRPGTLLIAPDAPATRVRVVRYSRDSVVDQEISDISEVRLDAPKDEVTWIDVQGFGDEALLQQIAERFHIHPLAMEDVVNAPQRPKAELYSGQLLIIVRIVTMPTAMDVGVSQLGMIVGPQYVITFQDQYNDRFEPVLQRIARPTARLRQNGPSYLAYAILDTAVDAAYPVLESLGEQLEWLERQVIANPQPQLLSQVNRIRNRLVDVRRATWPQRDAVQALLVIDNDLIRDEVKVFLRDTYDHCVQTAEVIEMYRETASGLLNTYLSSVAHRSNEVMKVLTMMSSIFVPLTFIAGIYGMNFEHMPELSLTWMYPGVWCVMLATAAGMLWFFRRRGWISISRLNDAQHLDEAASPDLRNQPSPAARVRILEHDQLAPGRSDSTPPDGSQLRRAS